jgi:benzoate/toluate 1,2-dioxygenase reductase subunit
MASIALNFEDGVTRFIEGNAGETVAETAYRLGFNIPLDCADGACGTCKCRVRAGSYDGGDYIEDALSDEEAAEGFALACQMRPETAVVVDILASSDACKVQVGTFETAITSISFLSPEIVKLEVKTSGGQVIDFLPGQYANIEIPGTGLSRSYSFSGTSGTDALEFLIRLVPDGLASTYFKEEAAVGATLNLTGSLGSFYVREITQPTLFFAGGTGIAPFLAMLEKLVAEDVQVPVTVFYGATTDDNVVELQRLQDFSNKMPLTVFTCVSLQESRSHAIGFVTQWITAAHLNQNIYDIYICGPNPMVEAVKYSLAEEQIAYTNFYTEKFVPTGAVA